MGTWTVPGYEERRQLGHGATGRVVAAIHVASGTSVAIKYLSPKLFRDPAFLGAFREEAELLRSLDVPDVVRIYDYVEATGQGAAIVMELVEGVSLHEMIARQGATTPEAALFVLKGSLLGLAAAHSLGIVHRDYKPENVLVDGNGRSKLSDFGVAVRAGNHAPAAGTPLYMAPEQWAGAPATPATDIYAASAVFFECLTSKTPFSGRLDQLAAQHETAAVPLVQVDEPVRRLIARGMAKAPQDRPVDAVAFIEELDWVAESAYGPDWDRRGRTQLARRAAALLALLFGAGVAAGGTGVAIAASSAGGQSFLTHLLSAITGARRLRALGLTGRKAAVAVAVASVVALAAVGGTTYVLASSHPSPRPPGPAPASPAPPGPSTGATSAGGAGPSPSAPATPSSTPTPTPSASATPTAATAAPTTTAPTTKPATPPTTKAPTTPPDPALSVSLSSATPMTEVVACGTAPPAFLLTGSISSNVTTTVSYQWSGPSGKSGTATIKAGGSVTLPPIAVTPAPGPAGSWSGTETLEVTSPVMASNSLPLSASCTPTSSATPTPTPVP